MLLYLDIDGVMVPANSWRRPEILEDGFPAFDFRAVKALQKILSATGASIVLTTSHKSVYPLNKWRSIFERRGISVNKIDRLPANTLHLNRKDELLNWFANHPQQDNFIILDDDKILNALPTHLKDHVVLTSGSVGLTDYIADEALEKINENMALYRGTVDRRRKESGKRVSVIK